MPSTKTRGYLLPPGEAFTDDLACALVYFPNKPEYRRALRGALDYMATWTAWELDPDKRGKDAARAWKLANEKTQECIEMGVCLEDLIDAVNKISIIVNHSTDCFCDAVHINPPPVDYDDHIPGLPFPETWGGTEITSELQYRRAVCAAANHYVDVLKEQNDQLLGALSAGIAVVALIAAILGVLSTGGILAPVAWGTAVTVFSGLVGLGVWDFLGDFNTDIENARAEIVEAIVCGFSLGNVIEEAIDEQAWTLFYHYANWDRAAAIVRTGVANGETLEYGQSDTCDSLCLDTNFALTFTFDADLEDWIASSGVTWLSGTNNVRINVSGSGSPANLRLDVSAIWSLLGLATNTPLTFKSISYQYASNQLTLPSGTRASLNTDQGNPWTSEDIVIPTVGGGNAQFIVPDIVLDTGSDRVVVLGIRNGGTAPQFIVVDNITITGTFEPPA